MDDNAVLEYSTAADDSDRLTEALVGNGGDSNNPSPAPGSGKAKREKKPVGEMTEKAKHRKAQSAWRKHLQVGSCGLQHEHGFRMALTMHLALAGDRQIEYNFPKNPETSYLIFRNKHQPAIREDIVKKNPEMTTVSMKIVSDAVAAKWKNLSESEKAVYEKEAEKKKKEHEKAIEDWKRKYPHLSLEVSEEDVDKFAMKEERGRKRKSVGGAGESEEEKEASPEPEEEPVKDKGKKKDKVEKKDEKKEVVAPAPAPVKEDKKKGKEVKEDRSKVCWRDFGADVQPTKPTYLSPPFLS